MGSSTEMGFTGRPMGVRDAATGRRASGVTGWTRKTRSDLGGSDLDLTTLERVKAFMILVSFRLQQLFDIKTT